jgi:type IV secretion system protein VirD4
VTPDELSRALDGVVSALWWLVPVALVAIAALVVFAVVVRSVRYRHAPGLASTSQVLSVASRSALRRSAKYTRPGWNPTRKYAFREVGTRVGKTGVLGRTWFGASHEDAIGVIAPQRQGKTRRLLARFVEDAPGTVIAASTKLDLLDLTRERIGDRSIWIFDPDVIASPRDLGVTKRVHWSPVVGCEVPSVAIRRAEAFVGDGGASDATNARFFAGSAAQVLQCLLHAAALGGHSMADVVRWAADSRDREPVQILGSHTDAAAGWSSLLAGHITGSRSEADVFKQLVLSLNLFADPAVLAAATPASTAHFDVDRFLLSGDALYLLTSNRAVNSSAYATLFVSELVARAQDLAPASATRRLEPPVSFVIDELVNTARVPTFPSVLSDSGGRGLAIRWAAQSRAQLIDVWGRHGAQAVLDNSTWKVVLQGLDDADYLADMERLGGRVDRSSAFARDDRPRESPALASASVRQQRRGTATVWSTAMPPFRAHLVDIDRDHA